MTTTTTTDWASLMTTLGREFAKRSAEHDQEDSFVAENYAALRERGAFAAGVPAELGGGGATHGELCGMIRELARHCGSTALAFSIRLLRPGSRCEAMAPRWLGARNSAITPISGRRKAIEPIRTAPRATLRRRWSSSRRSSPRSQTPSAAIWCGGSWSRSSPSWVPTTLSPAPTGGGWPPR